MKGMLQQSSHQKTLSPNEVKYFPLKKKRLFVMSTSIPNYWFKLTVRLSLEIPLTSVIVRIKIIISASSTANPIG